jgi:hypothetical protein
VLIPTGQQENNILPLKKRLQKGFLNRRHIGYSNGERK